MAGLNVVNRLNLPFFWWWLRRWAERHVGELVFAATVGLFFCLCCLYGCLDRLCQPPRVGDRRGGGPGGNRRGGGPDEIEFAIIVNRPANSVEVGGGRPQAQRL